MPVWWPLLQTDLDFTSLDTFVVSGLVLNFLPDLLKSIEEMREHACKEGTVAAYVWDYAGRMEYLTIFWDEVIAMDPLARDLDQGATISNV